MLVKKMQQLTYCSLKGIASGLILTSLLVGCGSCPKTTNDLKQTIPQTLQESHSKDVESLTLKVQNYLNRLLKDIEENP